jgi:phage terminase large subunit-like protein
MPLPLFALPPLSKNFLSYGPLVASWAERRIGLKLLTWQRWALDRMLEVDPATGLLRFREVYLSVSRRNGKTALCRALIGWVLEESAIFKRSMNAAFVREQAGLLFNAVALDMVPLGCEANASGTRIGIGHRGADRWHTYVSGRSSGWRGMGQDLAILDEAQEQRDEDAWAALEPMTRTSPNGLILAIGTASLEGAVLFARLYDRAKLAVMRPGDDLRYGVFIWEAVSDDDVGIRAANPAVVDGLLTMDVLRATRRSQTPARFQSETCNRWINDPLLSWAPPGAWESCGEPNAIAPNDGIPTFAVDVAPSWMRGSIAVAMSDDDAERIHVEVARDWPEAGATVAEAEVVSEVQRILAAYPRSLVGYDPQSAISTAMKRLGEDNPRVVPVGGTEFRGACAAFLGHVVGKRLRHRADPVLNSAARLAARSEDAEAWRFVRRRSAGYIDALVAATIAVHLNDRPKPPKPVIY